MAFSIDQPPALPISYGSYQMMQYPLPNGSSSPWSITSDRLGRVWFVQQQPAALMMFTPSTDNFTQYLISNGTGSPPVTPEGVAADRFDNVWFTELTTDKLGELKNTSGAIEQYDIPSNFAYVGQTAESLPCGPTVITTDTSGSVWIACPFSNQIDEFIPKNQTFLAFDLPYWQSAPSGFVFDESGNLWFTAADVNMIGHAVLNELHNGTTDGITEFAPQNSTYSFTFAHIQSLAGSTENLTSSLRSPSGISLSPDGTTLWITEHVDSSFDSYNINSKILERFWTSQTFDEYGFAYSFPNGVAVDSQGNVWISEHYGNRIAEFTPGTGQLIEFPIPARYGGAYDLSLGPNGTIWFVEIAGAAIGELEPVDPPTQSLSINLAQPAYSINGSGAVSIPLLLNMSGKITGATMNVSGITSTGILSKAQAIFSRPTVSFSSLGNIVNETLVFTTKGLDPGVYDLTVSATAMPSGEIYSTILKIDVTSGQNTSTRSTDLYFLTAGVVASVCVVGFLFAFSRRQRPARVRRKFRRR